MSNTSFDVPSDDLDCRNDWKNEQDPQCPSHKTCVEDEVTSPRMDMYENTLKKTITAVFELPGIKKADIIINVHDNCLNISAERKIPNQHQRNGYVVRERQFGKVFRTLQLPDGVKEQDIETSMENGVLCITFPKIDLV